VPIFTFNDLIDWSTRLPDWQRDALRRILTNNSLVDSDISDLTTLAKVACGIYQPTGVFPPDPATNAHIRASGAATPPVSLLAINDIAYVNALAAGPITFAPDGLNVVYGDNAAGKSGIARILKKAGRARSPGGAFGRAYLNQTRASQPVLLFSFARVHSTAPYPGLMEEPQMTS
jgi:hypothetical protein